MRIRISHATSYHYETPPKSVTQVLRLTPRNDDGQFVVNWRIDVSQDCQLHQHEDAFGNVSHVFSAEGPFDELSVTVAGEVDTHDTHGIVNGAIERFPPGLYLRETALTTPDGRVTILMPHPERVFRAVQLSWNPFTGPDSPWMRIFRNARVWVG